MSAMHAQNMMQYLNNAFNPILLTSAFAETNKQAQPSQR